MLLPLLPAQHYVDVIFCRFSMAFSRCRDTNWLSGIQNASGSFFLCSEWANLGRPFAEQLVS